LSEVVAAWALLAEPLKAAVLAIIRTAKADHSNHFPGTPPPLSGETTNPAEHKEK
jgi:hypothetical protein